MEDGDAIPSIVIDSGSIAPECANERALVCFLDFLKGGGVAAIVSLLSVVSLKAGSGCSVKDAAVKDVLSELRVVGDFMLCESFTLSVEAVGRI
eukprot:2659033-Rhodomonas_salina.1